MSLLLLRHATPALSRVAACRRAARDVEWRAAVGLPWEVEPPDEKTMREFEAFLAGVEETTGLTRMQLVFEFWVRRSLEHGLVGPDPAWVLDSTPMDCYGAVLDTINLLGEGLRRLARRFATATGTSLETLAAQWDAPLLLAQSAKGHFAPRDWGSDGALSDVLVQLSEVVTRCVQHVLDALPTVRDNKRLPLARRARTLLQVLADDVVTAADGTMSIAVRRSAARLISLTEPDAQHFRKSSSQVCSGFKLHLLGDAISGLIAAVSVRPGGEHDSTQAHPLLLRAQALLGQLEEVLADSAYGGMPVRTQVYEQLGVRLLAPPPPESRGEGLGKADFAIHFDAMVATCPGGVATGQWKLTQQNGEPVPTFCWAVGSEADCHCRDQCPVHRRSTTKKGRRLAPRRRLLLHPDEQQLRYLREQWRSDLALRARYRRRSLGERLIREMTRRGARQAQSFGLAHAQLQVHVTASASNLRLLALRLAQRAPLAKVA